MEVVQGTGVFGGVAIGPLRVLVRQEQTVPEYVVENRAAEMALFEQARAQAAAELDTLYAEALKTVGEAEAAIFEIHRMMLDDLDFVESVTGFIEGEGRNAQWAVSATVDTLAEMFSAMDDEYMRARAADVRDIGRRVMRALQGKTAGTEQPEGVLAADDLDPGETVGLDPARTPALVTTRGSTTSHTAILARTKGIPAVIGLGRVFTAEDEGRMAVVDGENACLILDPDEATLAAARLRVAEQAERAALLQRLRGQDNVSRSGRRIDVFANIGRVDEVAAAIANDAGGIGLFRSEFLYLERDSLPSEEVLFGTYRAVVQGMAGRKVIFRTLDIGADKQAAYLNLDKEDNPALGLRGVRLCLDRPEMFRTQLRAMYRASAVGPISIMVPMIISVSEVRRVRAMAEAVRAELLAEGHAVAEHVELGIMIETPAAAVISDLLAPEVDFFSIGTNDLTQYVLAADRQNHKLAPFIDTHHPALLRLIRTVAENAHAAGIWVGICGELAANRSLTQTFLDMGIDELSVSPALVLPLRETVLHCE